MNRRYVYKQLILMHNVRLGRVLMDRAKAEKVKSSAPKPLRIGYLASERA